MSDPQATVEPTAPQARVVAELLVDDVEPAGLAVADLSAWSDRLVAAAAPDVSSLAIRLTDATTMQALNCRYRGRDEPTDVLSFPGDVGPEGRHLGDIVIALPVASDQAVAAGHSLTIELKTLILHGVLHCLGHDHESDDGEMEALEAVLRAVWVSADD